MSAPGEGAFVRGAKLTRTARSRKLRSESTEAEKRLWNQLRSRSLAGCKFVRQDVIGPYTVDFICREHRLVIEVDGGQHAADRSDQLRDRWLVTHRYKVLRFWNNDVMSNMEGVLETIEAALTATPPHPDVALEREIRPLPASGER